MRKGNGAMSLNSNKLFNTITNAKSKKEAQTRMAVVTSISGNNIYLTFYGEEEMSQKPYKRLDSYVPAIGDTVVLQKVGSSYLITGKVV